MNELYIEKIIRLINVGLITVEDIKNAEYKTEVENRLTAQ